MAIREIVLPLVSYPAPVGEAAIKRCVAIAASVGAQITAVSFELNTGLARDIYTRPFSVDGRVIHTPEQEKSRANAEQMLKIANAAARSSGIECDTTIKRWTPDELSSSLAVLARTTDLSLVPIGRFDDIAEKIVEGLIFESGRPLMIFSEEMADRLSNSIDRIAIAWDHSQQATRAVADAMPLLKSAKTVRIITATDKKTAAEAASGQSLVKHLAAHGIKAVFETVPKGGASVGKVFEAYINEQAIDLLVMGAYRHSRLKEFFLGGATYTIIGHPPCWVLMSH